MPKFTLICRNEETSFSAGSTYTSEFSAENMHKVLEEVQYFLRGCGYYFDGNIDIVEDEPVSEGGGVDNDHLYEFGPVEDVVRTWANSTKSDDNMSTQYTININDITANQHSGFYYDSDRNK